MSGWDNHGNAYGATTPPAATPEALGYLFDGVDDYVNCGNKFDIAYNAAQTYVAWIKTSQTTYGTIMGKSDADIPYQGWWFAIDGGLTNSIRWEYVQTVTTNHLWKRWQNVLFSNGNWHHIVVVKGNNTANNLKLYLDGVEQTNVSNIYDTLSTTVTTSIPFQIGIRDSFKYPFNGTINEVRIYNRALNATEIKRLYERKRILFGI